MFKLRLREFKQAVAARASAIVDAVCHKVYARARDVYHTLRAECVVACTASFLVTV